MRFSDKSRRIGDLLDEEGAFPTKARKFVFQIYPENISFIESLSYQEKQIIINDLISKYRQGNDVPNIISRIINPYKKLISVIITILIVVSFLTFISSLAWNASQLTNYSMQKNFEKLF